MDESLVRWIHFDVDPASVDEILSELQIDLDFGNPPLIVWAPLAGSHEESGGGNDPQAEPFELHGVESDRIVPSDKCASACLVRTMNAKSARLMAWRTGSDPRAELGRLIRRVEKKLLMLGICSLESLIPSHQHHEISLLESMGFKQRGRIRQLWLTLHGVPHSQIPDPPSLNSKYRSPDPGLRWTDDADLADVLRTRLIDRTLHDSHDLRWLDSTPQQASDQVENLLRRSSVGSRATCRVLWQGRDAVGFFYLSQSGKTTELVYLGIAQGFRGRGLSRVLMGEVFKAARQNSSQILLTAVDDDNQPALRLYSRYPFHEASCFMFMERALAGRSR